jgi:hypothetical protein
MAARYSRLVDEQGQRESPDELMREMELRLESERQRWQRAHERQQTIRMLSFSLISLVVLGGIILAFLAFSRTGELRSSRPVSPSPAASSAR